MSIVTLNNVGQTFGDFDVFSGASAAVPHGAKIGLVGPNGIGKTSLLLILAGITQPAHGGVSRARGIRLGYLRQEAMEAFDAHDNTVYEEMLTVFADVQAQEARLRAMEEQMSAGDYSDELMQRYGNAQERFEMAGGYDYEVRIQQTLQGLGLGDLWDMLLPKLSGGQKTRALLARLLLEKPDLLILDEPTNHLDVEAVEWLEHTLNSWDGALLVVSHDRYFLDNVVNTIWEMSRAGIETYRGNYSAYLRQRQERWERHQAVYEQEKERLEKEIDYIKRNIARASTNAMAVGRLRRLSRRLEAIEHYGVVAVQTMTWSETGLANKGPMGVAEAEGRIKEISGPTGRPPRLNLNLKVTLRGGETVLRTNELFVGFPDNPLFTADDIVLNRLETAALIGANGTGKTTFLRTLLSQLKPLGGMVRLGHNLKIGYFAQAHDGLNPGSTVIDELIRHKSMKISEARQYLAPYLFRGDDPFKLVSSLSGGERARLALAILSLDGANVLLLDEPTNHLDIPAQEALQETLEAFEGTILLVTHDRYLVDKLATQVWDLRDGHLHVFKGLYKEYLAARTANDDLRMTAREKLRA
ncbi:MAG: ATP-binding cassette domain-containing protein [Anaerolineae bacterium]|nr:ATP-binding cassette domain-containing protein [Anaerolineae bacterium]